MTSDTRIDRYIGRCIYCPKPVGRLGDEHIIPLGLGGIWVLREASCEKCTTITGNFEQSVQRKTLLAPRVALGLPTRRPKERPSNFPLRIDGNREISVHIDQYPTMLALPLFPPPGHFDQSNSESGLSICGLATAQVGGPPIEQVANTLATKRLAQSVIFEGHGFARLLAKIAYGYAVAEHGLESIDPVYVLPGILGESDDIGRWVGCDGKELLSLKTALHTIGVLISKEELLGRVRLFAKYNAPEYVVVIGRLRQS